MMKKLFLALAFFLVTLPATAQVTYIGTYIPDAGDPVSPNALYISNGSGGHVPLSSIGYTGDVNEMYFSQINGSGVRTSAATVGLYTDGTMFSSSWNKFCWVYIKSSDPHPCLMQLDALNGYGLGVGYNVAASIISGYTVVSIGAPAGGGGGLAEFQANGTAQGWIYGTSGALNFDSVNSASLIFHTNGNPLEFVGLPTASSGSKALCLGASNQVFVSSTNNCP